MDYNFFESFLLFFASSMFIIVYGFCAGAFLKCPGFLCWGVQVAKLNLDFRKRKI